MHNNYMKQTIIFSFIVGVLVTVLSYQMYVNFEFQKTFNADHATLTQVVTFLNQQITKNNPTPTK